MASNEASPWPTVTLIGVLCGITFGLVLYSLIRRRDEEEPKALANYPDFDAGSLPVVNMVPKLGKSRPSAARTLNISDSKPTMLIRAVGGDWRVSVRALSPVSSFATCNIGKETDSSIVVPTGSSQEFWLPKGQYLYAQGSQPGVCVSVSGGEV